MSTEDNGILSRAQERQNFAKNRGKRKELVVHELSKRQRRVGEKHTLRLARRSGSTVQLPDRGSPERVGDYKSLRVPVRQFVLSFPYELSGLAATRPDVLASLCRLLNEAISLHYRTWAKSAGYTGAQTGAVSFVHRFGSSLNLHIHFHVIVLDGVYDARG